MIVTLNVAKFDIKERDKMSTQIMPVSDLRRKTSDVISAVHGKTDVIFITQHGRPAVVLMDYARYEQLMAELEDLSDQASLEAARHEPVRPYEDFLAERA
jgi:prevent-host-death family protein